MTLKHVLKHFSKTEVQEDRELVIHNDKTRNMSLRGAERRGNLFNRLDCFAYARNDDLCAEHTEKHLFSYSPIHLFTFKKVAFTLAEVLITLAIIGVVAAMTMPTLIQNQQKRSLEVATQKFYSMMSQAVRQYMADEGVDDLRNTPLAGANYEDSESPEAIESMRNFVMKYLKVVEECDHDANNCFVPKYKAWDGSVPDYNVADRLIYYYDNLRYYVLADGSIIGIGYHSPGTPIELYVDINGKKGPNRVGHDLWSMSIFYDGSIDESSVTPECKKDNNCQYPYDGVPPSDIRQERFSYCYNGGYGGCFGHFLENNFKFDY